MRIQLMDRVENVNHVVAESVLDMHEILMDSYLLNVALSEDCT